MTHLPATHTDFIIERDFAASPEAMFHARADKGTHMAYTEQLAYLAGHEDRALRLRGTEESLDRLVLAL